MGSAKTSPVAASRGEVAVPEGALELLRRELATLWRVDAEGRLAGVRSSDPGPLPWVVVASDVGGAGRVWACSVDLDPRVVDGVDALLSGGADVRAVAPLVAGGVVHEGPSYVGPAAPAGVRDRLVVGAAEDGRAQQAGPEEPVGVRDGIVVGVAAHDRERLAARMPEEDRAALVEPWVVALAEGGDVGSVCETARDAPVVAGVEAGVWTYEPFRRRGLAVAAVSAWMDVQAGRGRTAFSSTSADNLASQGVARRLGLRPLGWWWSVRPS